MSKSWRLVLFLLLAFGGVHFQAQRVTLSLEPPANNTRGVLFFEYCPTGSVSVNVTCKVEGLDTGLGIKPQVMIGPDHFYLSNQMKVEKWRIIVFTNSHTLLYFDLPLTGATAGQAISCQSESFSSQNITLQSNTGRCVNPTTVIPPSTSSGSSDTDHSSAQSSSRAATVTNPILRPTNNPGKPGSSPILQGSIASAALTLFFLVAFVVGAIAIRCGFYLNKRKTQTGDVIRITLDGTVENRADPQNSRKKSLAKQCCGKVGQEMTDT